MKIKHYLCSRNSKQLQTNTIMVTLAQAKQFAKEAKINIEHFDHIRIWTNEAFTKMYVDFFELQVSPSGGRKECNSVTITKSVAAMLKKDIFPDEYETNGSKWIYELK